MVATKLNNFAEKTSFKSRNKKAFSQHSLVDSFLINLKQTKIPWLVNLIRPQWAGPKTGLCK